MSESAPPKAWIEAVCDCLRSADRKRIVIRVQALSDWEALFPDAFLHHLYAALASALRSSDLEAKRVASMAEAGDTYEFFFYCWSQKLYGKICLQPSGQVIIVYSAHRPRRPTL